MSKDRFVSQAMRDGYSQAEAEDEYDERFDSFGPEDEGDDMEFRVPEDAEKLRHLYDALKACRALIAGSTEPNERRRWIRQERGLEDEIRMIEAKKTP